VRGDHLGQWELPQQFNQLPSPPRIEVAGWLVEHQDFRVHAEDRGDGDPLLLPHAEVVGRAGFGTAHSHLLQGLLYPQFHLFLGASQVERAEGHVVEDSGGEELILWVLKDQPHLAPDPLEVPVLDGQAENPHRTIVAPEEAIQVEQEGGFTRPIGADEGHPLPSAHDEADSSQRLLPIGVGVRQPLDLDRSLHIHPPDSLLPH